MQKPDVSVILPVMNGASTLPACLHSILEQTLNLELIVILGPSSDGSEEIISNCNFEGLVVLKDAGKGVYAAMNQGIQEARAEWLYFIGADDKLTNPQALTNLFELADVESKLIFGDVEYSNIQHSAVPVRHKSSFDAGLIWRNRLHHQGTIYRESCFADGLFNEDLKIFGDYEINLKLLKKGASAIKYDGVIAECEASGLSKNFNWNLYKEELKMKKDVLSTWEYALNIPWVVLKFLLKKITA